MIDNQAISTIGADNQEGLQIVAKNLQTAILSGSNDALQAVNSELNRRPGLISLLFPGKILKQNEELTIQNMKDVYETRQNLLKGWVNAQLELTKNQGQMIIKSKLQGYEGELSQQAMQIRADLAHFSQRKIAEMMDAIERSRSEFAERIDRQTKNTEKYKDNTFLYQKLNQNLEKETEIFFQTIEALLNGFTEALKDKLSKN